MTEVLIAIAALVVSALAGVLFGKRSNSARRDHETLRDVQKGQDAVTEGRRQGTPDERLRRNDGSW